MTTRLRSVWAMPPVEGAPGPMRRDWLLVVALLVVVVVEAAARPDLEWRAAALGLGVLVAVLFPWRRARPAACVVIAFGAILAVQLADIASGSSTPVGLVSTASVLAIPYATARWGSGRSLVLLVALLACLVAVGRGRDYRTVGDAVAEVVVLTFPVMLGLVVRAQATAKIRDSERTRAEVRLELARDLHDTVAHHVSAMVVRAQAGRVVGTTEPGAALEALKLIEDEGSRTLAEMRLLVGALRGGTVPTAFSPTASIRDIANLADDRGRAGVRVRISGDVDTVNPAVAAALYRIAQESVTNATRHATSATAVNVDLHVGSDDVILRVTDDGADTSTAGTGFGIAGMRERAAMFGGSLRAGPADDGGWVVDAVMPRAGR